LARRLLKLLKREKLVGIELEGEPIIKAPENFWVVNNIDNKKIGRVSRAFHSPRLKKNIGLAIVDINYAEEETKFSVATPNGDLQSVVVSMPWFEADKDTHLD
jgi:aminomethyltransferase